MEKTFTGFLGTNENFYEILWNARMQYFLQNLSQIQNIDEALTALRQADTTMYWGAGKIEGISDGVVSTYYTGEVALKPRDPKEAEQSFLISEEANKLQIETILELAHENVDTIVELGAGYGSNLIRLASGFQGRTGDTFSQRDIKLIMAEYTSSGRALCSEFLKLKNAPDMSLEHIDHKEPDLSFINQSERLLIFTIHSIEQVAKIPPNYFDVLSRAAPIVHGVHIEPVGFQFEPDSSKWDRHRAFVEKNGWNQNFAEVIRKAESDGLIAIDSIDTNFSAGQPENPSTLVTWHSNR